MKDPDNPPDPGPESPGLRRVVHNLLLRYNELFRAKYFPTQTHPALYPAVHEFHALMRQLDQVRKIAEVPIGPTGIDGRPWAEDTREATDIVSLRNKGLANTRIEGLGEQTVQILPCPACSAPDWMRFPVTAAMNDYADQKKATKCEKCGRTMRVVFEGNLDRDGAVNFHVVQTAGPELPEWYEPKLPKDPEVPA